MQGFENPDFQAPLDAKALAVCRHSDCDVDLRIGVHQAKSR
jgi:hypothetical protein